MPEILQATIWAALVVLGAWGLGCWMALVFDRPAGRLTLMTRVEGAFCRFCGADPRADQSWVGYAGAALAFNLAGALLLYALLLAQGALPLNPAGLPGLDPALAFNTAISFVTNTDWQSYGGETTLSPLSQMAGLTTQNFVSAATGVAVGVAVIRGFTRAETPGVGVFWVDLVRAVLWLLLPASVVVGLALVALGAPQTLDAAVAATTLEGGSQTVSVGPVASQIAIKQLGTNGGGYFNANSAHPLENPGALSNLIQLWAILAIPAAFCVLYGRMARDARQGRALFWAMGLLFLAGFAAIWASEATENPLLAGVATGGGVMEGKEARFGVMFSALWAAATTAASNGSVNAMLDSFSPLGGGVALFNILIGEVVFGGVGAGLYGMLLFVVLTVFVAGLMVGRTPAYLGKKIEAREVKLAVLAFLVTPVGALLLGGLAAVAPPALTAVQDPGPHGLTEILYAYASAVGNNGSAFAGYGAGSTWHLTAQGFAMLLGRYGVIVPMLAIAGSLAVKKAAPESAGAFPTHGPLFIGLLIGTIVVLGGLTFFPALALGPIAEHLATAAGQGFGG